MTTDTRKAIALLAYLTQRETAPDRDHLVELLWPGSDPQRGRGALRRTISTLRSALGGRWVYADRDRVGLDRTDLWTDTDSICQGGESALSLVRGRFLEGFWLRDAPDFDDWQMATAEHYDRIVRRLLSVAIEDALIRGDTQQAISWAERLLALDALDEAGHRALMSAYAAAGDRTAATRQFRRCVAVLESQLGVSPLPATVELHEAILAGTGVEQARSDPGPPVPRTSAPPIEPPLLLARDSQLARLRELVSSPGVVAVTGPSGSGRSRLIAEALPDAIVAGAHVEERDIPHSLTRSLLDSALTGGRSDRLDGAAAAAGHIHPTIATRLGPPPPLDNDLGPMVLLAGISAALSGLVGDRPLVVDDLDDADPASVAAVKFLAGRAAELGLRLVLVTAEPHHRSVALGPLDVDSIADLVRDTGLDPDALIITTGGLPGPLVEVLSDPHPGEALDRLRVRRLDLLPPTDLQILEGLAVLGRSAPAQVTTVTGRSPEEAAAAIDRLSAAGLIVGREEIGVPAWVAELILERLGPGRSALLHGRAADALGSHTDLQSTIARAWHLHRAGRRQESAQAHAEAGRATARIHAYDIARVHLHAAIAAGHPEPGALHRQLGDMERAAGRYPEAVAAYHAAAAHGTDSRLERSIGDVYRRWGRWDLADAAFASAESISPPPELALTLADRAEVAFRRGDVSEASDLVERALAAAGDDLGARARVHNVAGLILDDPARLSAAVTDARRASLREEEAAALNNLALALLRRNQAPLALDHATRSLLLLSHGGDRHRSAAVHGNLADIHHALGDETQSREHLIAAVKLFAEIGIEPGDWEPEVWKLTSW